MRSNLVNWRTRRKRFFFLLTPLVSVTHFIVFAIVVIFHTEKSIGVYADKFSFDAGVRDQANYCLGN
ncbi:hypothetical protein BDV24DRAFT_142976 [Aspergillus arachidicola]|uniref:Uncharacterized protein n=1 Tax=Aspergillus arachidicola TaxID=656916 RepID=A0A5N6XS90_9EURO|nr:hypothetical protein BDV24DRAFT_142976 [Aspergillus arachidicola]